MQFRVGILATALLSACSNPGPRAVSATDADFMMVYLAQQRIQQQLFLLQLDSIRIKQCAPSGFVFECR